MIRFDNSYIILFLYADNMFIVGACIEENNTMNGMLPRKLLMKDLVVAKQILGTRITRDR